MKELKINHHNAETHFVYAGSNPLRWVEMIKKTYGEEYDGLVLIMPLSRNEIRDRFGIEDAVLGDVISSPEITEIDGMNVYPVGICVLSDINKKEFNLPAIENAMTCVIKTLKSNKLDIPVIFSTMQRFSEDISDILGALLSKVNTIDVPLIVDMGIATKSKNQKISDNNDIGSMIKSSKKKKKDKKKDKKKNKKKDKKKKNKKKGWYKY